MNQYYELLKQEVIVFEKLLIDKYHLIGLNEYEAIILIKLNKSLKEGKRRLIIDEVIPNMTLDKDQLSNIVIDLVNRGYIGVELSAVDALETFNLEGTIRRLSDVFDTDNQPKTVVEGNITKVINLIENESGKQVSSIDIEIITKWFNDYHYSVNEIEEAIYKAAKNKKVSVKYCDRILYNSKSNHSNVEDSSEIKELISKVYGKN